MTRLISAQQLVLICTAGISLPSVATTPPTWKTECVGRTQFSLPVEVEVAGLPFENFAAAIEGGSRSSGAQFIDGQWADYSRVSYLVGLILVSNELNDTQISELRARFSKQPEVDRKYLKERSAPSSGETNVTDVHDDMRQLLSWTSGANILYLQRIRNHLVTAEVSSRDQQIEESTQIFKTLTQHTIYRDLFTVPAGSGVCLPFAFVKDRGVEPRSITTTYRLKAHPDVTIIVQDASAPALGKSNRRVVPPDEEIDNFWSQYEISRTGRKVTSHWKVNAKRSVQIDGRKAIASFVDIVRKDNSKDIGYFATVPGNSTPKADTPKITLAVIREANHARAKGVQPIDEKAFLDLVERIVLSISKRPH
ncbi:T6SS immunity protein Tli4 family protein [Pseudoduganella sp.]|uniref:T6SS immunity protein Tli4 family protein n=1 Tax=Pseudoduganella sp. TaxID=1880898 RepID=UPI0035B4978B